MSIENLVTFLETCATEDEQAALAVTGDVDRWWVTRLNVDTDLDPIYEHKRDNERTTLAQRFDPPRALRTARAVRKIVAAYQQRERDGQHPETAVFSYHATGLLVAMTLLAGMYSDRPGYEDVWLP